MKHRLGKKRLLFGLAFLILLYSFWLGTQLLRFSPQRTNVTPEKSPPHEIVGVYHIHTTFSDGLSSPDKIARIAARQGLDFIILTDHGKPNLRCLESQGWKDGLLLLAGSELSVSRGHLVALDFAPPRRPFSQNAEDAAREIRANGGFSVIAHPFSKVRWSWGEEVEYAGLEIIDADTMFKKNLLPSLPYLPALLFKPGFYLLKTLERPVQTLRKWDELNETHVLYGYFSADAHLFYRVILSGFHLHVLLDAPLSAEFDTARSQVFGALRQGRFYSAVNAAGNAAGFRFWAEGSGSRFPMGSVIPLTSASSLELHVLAPFSSAVETRFIHNGKTIRSAAEKETSVVAQEPGTYRVEAYLREWSPLTSDIPWIVSNPIFLRKDEK
ncbi:MAG: hypothetical protein QHH14_08080 [Clostridiales bacterium]|nr:hypothetical protein [Clostridiales bacterium]